ncbi:MAG TPA: methyltransferase domain-containing protein [Anaeromyxobacteraceae bacterium]|nr:methyltransferase domain-containing protein [Anaeromyxobacteraceae bacterium]
MSRLLRTDLVDAAVLEAFGLVREQGWLSDRALDRVLRREKRLYAQERRAVAESVYGILRSLGQLAFLLGAGEREPDLATLYALHLARSGPTSAEAAARRLGLAPRLIADALERADARIAALEDPLERLSVESSLPRWIAERFVEELGAEEGRALALSLNARAPLTARANLLKTDRQGLVRRLEEEGVSAHPTRYSPWGLALDGHQNAFALPSFQEGLFEIQDEGSQLIALAVGARAGQVVVDACAGAGGKALALAAEMHGKGSLHGLDRDPERLEEARRRARRAEVHNLRTRTVPPGPEAGAALADLAGACDRVLVDAPCSGLGSLRRHPDLRYRLGPAEPARFAALQKELLLRYAQLLRPGGRLVYATCAIGRLENEEVASFVARELLSPCPLAAALGADLAAALGARGETLQLLPHRHGTDGFFLSAFVRT